MKIWQVAGKVRGPRNMASGRLIWQVAVKYTLSPKKKKVAVFMNSLRFSEQFKAAREIRGLAKYGKIL